MVSYTEYLKQFCLNRDSDLFLFTTQEELEKRKHQAACQEDIEFAFQADCVTDTPSIEPT